jgi:glutaredoxin 3
MPAAFDVRKIPPGSKLELYIKPTCPYCREAMQYYDDAGIAYDLHDAQNNRDARARMFAYTDGDPTVPAIIVDGTYVQSGWGTPPRG